MVYYSHMNSIQRQIRLNLPEELMDYLLSGAQRYGLPITAYLKHLIMKDADRLEYPVFEPSERTEKRYLEAVRNEDKAIKATDDVGKFLDNL